MNAGSRKDNATGAQKATFVKTYYGNNPASVRLRDTRIFCELKMLQHVRRIHRLSGTLGSVAVLGMLLAGCGSSLSSMPVIGAPKETPAPSRTSMPYPSVGESRTRSTKPLTAEERAKREAELNRSRTEAADRKRQQIDQQGRQQQ
jgi:hypothetical protein